MSPNKMNPTPLLDGLTWLEDSASFPLHAIANGRARLHPSLSAQITAARHAGIHAQIGKVLHLGVVVHH
jgi:hypothetical protein